jgi:hypothetical protein
VSQLGVTAFARVSANDGYGSSASMYMGPYDLNAPHDINKYYKNTSDVESLKRTCYLELRAWGMTPEGAAAVVGNMICESGCDPTRTQSGVSWENFSWGNTGLGLIQWTYWSLQADLFNTAAEMGKPWTDLSVQFEALKHLCGPNEINTRYLYVDGYSVYKATELFMDGVERPAVRNLGKRVAAANSVLTEMRNETPENYDGSFDADGGQDVQIALNDQIVSEWSLNGMPAMSGITGNLVNLRLPDAIKNYYEANNVVQIGSAIASRNEVNSWAVARRVIVFIGMVLVMYAIFLGCAMLLDNVNSFIDVSFVSLFSLGTINYSYDLTPTDTSKKYTSTPKMIAIIVVLSVIGLLCISGGLFSFLMKSVYSVYNILSGKS